MAPAAVHNGTAVALTAQRAITLDAAFAAHPIRFKGVAPKPPELPIVLVGSCRLSSDVVHRETPFRVRGGSRVGSCIDGRLP